MYKEISNFAFFGDSCTLLNSLMKTYCYRSFWWPSRSSFGFHTREHMVFGKHVRQLCVHTVENKIPEQTVSRYCLRHEDGQPIDTMWLDYWKCHTGIVGTPEGMIWKREGIWHAFRMVLHTLRIRVWRHDNSPPAMSSSTNLCRVARFHYGDVTIGTIASQITSLTIVYSTVYSDADQRKHQSSASLAFVQGIHRGPVNFPHKWPVTRKMFPFDDVIMPLLSNIPSTRWHAPFGQVWGP